MAIILIILFGALQGLTEFLPVSSSGHLTLFQFFTDAFEESLTLNIAVHLGTLLTVLIFYRKDIAQILRGVLKKEKEALGQSLFIIVAVFPTGVMGLFIKKFFSSILVNPMVSSICLMVTGAVLFSTKRLPATLKNKGPFGMSLKTAFLLGCVQGCAVLPGLSRSGLTIVAALWMGVDRKNAAKFSFLISVPAIFGAGLLELLGESHALDGVQLGIGVLVSFLVGLFAIYWMVRFTESKRLSSFSYYVWAVGLLTLGFQLFH